MDFGDLSSSSIEGIEGKMDWIDTVDEYDLPLNKKISAVDSLIDETADNGLSDSSIDGDMDHDDTLTVEGSNVFQEVYYEETVSSISITQILDKPLNE